MQEESTTTKKIALKVDIEEQLVAGFADWVNLTGSL